MKGCLVRIAAVAFWFGMFAASLACVLTFVGASSAAWRWGSLLGSAILGGVTLAAGRSEAIAKGLTALSNTPWSDAYESDYRRTTGMFSGAAVLGTFMLLWVFVGTMLLLFGE